VINFARDIKFKTDIDPKTGMVKTVGGLMIYAETAHTQVSSATVVQDAHRYIAHEIWHRLYDGDFQRALNELIEQARLNPHADFTAISEAVRHLDPYRNPPSLQPAAPARPRLTLGGRPVSP